VKVLLDTHAFLWWVADEARLSRRARELMAEETNDIFFSVASGWEIAIKTSIGRLSILGSDPESFVLGQLARNEFGVFSKVCG